MTSVMAPTLNFGGGISKYEIILIYLCTNQCTNQNKISVGDKEIERRIGCASGDFV